MPQGHHSYAIPIIHNVPGSELIAKYPVDNWNDQGQPYFSVASQRRLAMKIAAHDSDSLYKVMEVAQEL